MAALLDSRAGEALRLEIAAGLAQASRERDLARRQKLLRHVYELMRQAEPLDAEGADAASSLLARLEAGLFSHLEANAFLELLARSLGEPGASPERLRLAVNAWMERHWQSRQGRRVFNPGEVPDAGAGRLDGAGG
ncbi:MAG: hypothetical protein K6E40_06320 [Desulfovibrio sp.]|nr:hypothetical protein [Desulfovibrio sp.]